LARHKKNQAKQTTLLAKLNALLKRIEAKLDFKLLQEDLRKIGVTFITAGIVGIFMKELVNLALSAWLVMLGLSAWILGLYKR
jgi:hypothetical protein